MGPGCFLVQQGLTAEEEFFLAVSVLLVPMPLLMKDLTSSDLVALQQQCQTRQRRKLDSADPVPYCVLIQLLVIEEAE